MAQGSRILTGSERLDAAMSSVAPAEWRQVDAGISIVDHLAFLGANSVVMPGVTLAVGAVLGAGGVATRPIPAWEVWGGVPARRISLRDPAPLRARGVPVDELMERPLLEA